MNYHLKANLNKSDEKVIIRFTSGETREYDSLKALQQSEDFAEVFQAVESEQVFSIDFNVTAYIDKPNANLFRLNPKSVAAFAATGSDKPLLLDHKKKQTSRVGTVLSSTLGEKDGKPAIDSLVSARNREFQKDFLRGNVIGFSVGFDGNSAESVSYTHLTLPTILRV